MHIDLKEFAKITPEPYQLIIVTDGRYFHSGQWIHSTDGSEYFIPDSDDKYYFKYWAPLPTGIKTK